MTYCQSSDVISAAFVVNDVAKCERYSFMHYLENCSPKFRKICMLCMGTLAYQTVLFPSG